MSFYNRGNRDDDYDDDDEYIEEEDEELDDDDDSGSSIRPRTSTNPFSTSLGGSSSGLPGRTPFGSGSGGTGGASGSRPPFGSSTPSGGGGTAGSSRIPGSSGTSGGSGSSSSGAGSTFGSRPSGGSSSGSPAPSGSSSGSQSGSPFTRPSTGGGQGGSSQGASGGAGGQRPFGTSPSGSGSSGSSSGSSGTGGTSGGSSPFSPRPSSTFSTSSPSRLPGTVGPNREGSGEKRDEASRQDNKPTPKPDDKKPTDAKPSGGGGLGGIAGRFGGGGNKEADKKPADAKPSSGGGLGGIAGRFGGGASGGAKKEEPNKPADAKPSGGGGLGGLAGRLPIGGAGGAKKEEPNKPADAKPSGGGGLGGLAGRLPIGGAGSAKKEDDKKPAAPAAKKDEKPAGGGGIGGIAGRLPFGGAKKEEPKKPEDRKPTSPTASSSSAAPAKPGLSPFGQSRAGDPKKDDKPATPKKADSKKAAAGGSAFSRLPVVGGLFGGKTGQESAKKSKTSKAPTVQNEGLSLDTKLDIAGVALVFGGFMLLVSSLSPAQGAFTAAINTTLSQFLGWGAIAVPLTLLGIGGWLIARHFGESAPKIDPLRLVGLAMLYVGLLVALQYVESFNGVYADAVPGDIVFELALESTVQAGRGGGWTGVQIYMILLQTVSELGGMAVLMGWAVLGVMFLTRTSAAELVILLISVYRSFRLASKRRAQKRQAVRAMQAQKKAAEAAGLPAPAISVSKPLPDMLPPTVAQPSVPTALPAPAPALATASAAEAGLPAEQRSIAIRMGGQTVTASFNAAEGGTQPAAQAPAAQPTVQPVAQPIPAPKIPTPEPVPAAPAASQAGRGGLLGARLPFGGRPGESPAKPAQPTSAPTAMPPAASSTAPAPTGTPAGGRLGGGLFRRGDDKPAAPTAPASVGGTTTTPAATTASGAPATTTNTPPVANPPSAPNAAPSAAPSSPPASAAGTPSLGDLLKQRAAETPAESTTAGTPAGTNAPSTTTRVSPFTAPSPTPSVGTPPAAKTESGESAAAPDGIFRRPGAAPFPASSAGGTPLGARPPAASQPPTAPDRADEDEDESEDDLPMKPATPRGVGPLPRPAASSPFTPRVMGVSGSAADDDEDDEEDTPATRAPLRTAAVTSGLKPTVSQALDDEDDDLDDEDQAADAASSRSPLADRQTRLDAIRSGQVARSPYSTPAASVGANSSKPEGEQKSESASPFGVRPSPFTPTRPAASTSASPEKKADEDTDEKAAPFSLTGAAAAAASAVISAGGAAVNRPLRPPVVDDDDEEDDDDDAARPATPFTPRPSPFATPASTPRPAVTPPSNEPRVASQPMQPKPIDSAPKAPDVPPGVMQPAATTSHSTTPRINWRLPDTAALLAQGSEQDLDHEQLVHRARTIEETLVSFGAPGRVVEINTGPVITQFGVEPDYLTARGGKKQRVKVSAIAQLDKDLQLSLGAKSIRVEAPVPGKGYVGIEVPNEHAALVSLRDVLESREFKRIDSPLAIALGQSVDGTPVSADLTEMPHLLIAGTTGSGKSVCVNAIIASLLVRNTPEQVKFIMVDPKRVELTGYNGIPHLVAPVVVELERIVGVLKWVTREMDERYKKFSNAGARNIVDYNKHRDPSVEQMPYIVVIIDELADLMMLAPDETERVITRIAALARATGIHLVIATQRPSVDVVTGLIKANFPARIAFAVAGSVDSRVILDQPGAERLLGRGDMLYMSGSSPAPLRLQGVYVSDDEINNITRFWRQQTTGVQQQPITSLILDKTVTGQEAQPRPTVQQQKPTVQQATMFDEQNRPTVQSTKLTPEEDQDGDGEDDMYEEAVELVRRQKKASVSMLQRKLRIGYTRAARLIDVMEERGIVGPAQSGSIPRDVLKYED